MPSYVAFLRAINLGARRKFPKDDIRAAVEGAGFTGVETYINTGNVRLSTAMRSRERIEEKLEAAFLADRGFEVPTIVFPTQELAAIAQDAEELSSPDLARHYVWLLKQEPGPDVLEAVHALDQGGHRAVIRGRACHLLIGKEHRDGTVDPLRAEKFLGVATNRNRTVVTTLAQKWCCR